MELPFLSKNKKDKEMLCSQLSGSSGEKYNGITNLYHFIPADDAVFVDIIEPEAPQNFLFFRSFAQG